MSIQKSILSHVKRELLLKLFELGLSNEEGVKYIGSKMSEYTNTLSSVPFYNRSVQNAKNRFIQSKKSEFIGALVSSKGVISTAVNEVQTTEKIIRKWRREDPIFEQNVSHILNKFKNIKQPTKVVAKTDNKNRYYYEKGVLREIYCTGCNRSLTKDHFHRNNSRNPGYTSKCIICTGIQRTGRRPYRHKTFDFNKNEFKVEHNILGHKTKKRCEQCGQMRGKEDFPYLNRRIPVCKDCFDYTFVNVPPKRVEFRSRGGRRSRIRWYDDNGYPTHKKCSLCTKKKVLDDFSINRSNRFDGRFGQCRECLKQKRIKLNHKKRKAVKT